MAGASSRNKGANGEREVIRMLQPVVDECCDTCGHVRLVLKRNYTQRFEKKQYDIDGIPFLALEVKRVENQSGIGGWWRQTLEATRKGQTPVLIYRQNNAPWMVRTKVSVKAGTGIHIRMTVTMRFEDWLLWFKHRMKIYLNGKS